MIFVAAVGAHQVDPAFKHRLAGGGNENMSVLSLEVISGRSNLAPV